MKALTLTFLLLSNLFLFAQNPDKADEYIEEGLKFFDKEIYEEAIDYFDKALEVDQFNIVALSEKAQSYMLLKRYNEAIATCKLAIKKK